MNSFWLCLLLVSIENKLGVFSNIVCTTHKPMYYKSKANCSRNVYNLNLETNATNIITE